MLGYRGMKEYEIAFDGFAVRPKVARRVEGQGFRQLMASSRVRVSRPLRAQSGWRSPRSRRRCAIALERRQFGEPIVNFPRVADKLAMMAADHAGPAAHVLRGTTEGFG